MVISESNGCGEPVSLSYVVVSLMFLLSVVLIVMVWCCGKDVLSGGISVFLMVDGKVIVLCFEVVVLLLWEMCSLLKMCSLLLEICSDRKFLIFVVVM